MPVTMAVTRNALVMAGSWRACHTGATPLEKVRQKMSDTGMTSSSDR